MATERELRKYLAAARRYYSLIEWGDPSYLAILKSDLEEMDRQFGVPGVIYDAVWAEHSPATTWDELDAMLPGGVDPYLEPSGPDPCERPGKWSRPQPQSTRPAARGRAGAGPGGVGTKPRNTGGKARKKRGTGRRRRWVMPALVPLVAVVAGGYLYVNSRPHWPDYVQVMQKTEIPTACQNADVSSEPGQVNFACDPKTSQILWVFALMTSGGNDQFADAKTGRMGLEPINPVQGGELAWSIDLHHPYNPMDPIDSLSVAARAINNIIGGATPSAPNGKPVVEPGLESNPGNCARYTGSPVLISRAGFPPVCAEPITSLEGQAALAADVFSRWVPSATAAQVQNVATLFRFANDPGNPMVQAILKGKPQVSGSPSALGGGQGHATNVALGSAHKN
jgi:hypothetical protein